MKEFLYLSICNGDMLLGSTRLTILTFYFCPTQFVTRAVRVIDLITNMDMAAFQGLGGLQAFINRLEVKGEEDLTYFYLNSNFILFQQILHTIISVLV